MFSTEQEAKALAAELMQFARSQSVLVAPFSGEDEQRIAALNAGERAMASGAPQDASAAQLHRDLQTAAAHAAVGFTRAGEPAPRRLRRASASARRAAPKRRRARSSAPTARRRCRSRPERRSTRWPCASSSSAAASSSARRSLDSALARGHALTVFNRGRARRAWPEGVEAVVGDRSSDLAQVSGRSFDAVIDLCGYVPADLRASAAAFASCGRYCFVSSISAYASFAHAPVVEGDALASSDAIAEDDRDRTTTGRKRPPASASSTPPSASAR